MALCFSPISQAATAAGEALFDHTKTGFILKDVHTTLRCEQCHLDGIFKNTPKDCAGCHTTGSRIGASPKPLNHVHTTETCDTCHSSASSFQVKSFTHAGIASGEAGNCESCHNAQSQGVTSKPTNHFPTLQPCGLCHTNTVEFKSWTMDHKGLVSNCVSCHGATAELYPGVVFKPAAHVPTTAACETCHPSTKFDNFNGAAFIHITSGANSVKNNCKSCHTGQYKGVTVKHAGHIYDTNVQCDVCHTSANTNGYTSFLGAKYNHISATTPPALGNCFRCHDGATVTVTKKTAAHIPTTAACDTCHTRANTSNYTTFKGGSYTHASPNPGVCASCHNGATARGVASAVPVHVATTAACDTCHDNAKTSGYKSFLGAIYIHATPAGVCSSCHIGTPGTAFGSRLALGKSASHVTTNALCDTCHNKTNTSNYTTFTGASYVHATPPGVCSSCHKPGGPGLDKSVNHVPIGTVACDKCHTQSNTANYTTFFGAIFVHASPMLDRCDSCHFTNGPGKAKSFIPNHVSTTEDCSVCHSPVTIANYTTFTGANYIHPTPIIGRCDACHNGTIAIKESVVHVPIGSGVGCETCHDSGSTNNYTTFFGAKVHTAANTSPGVCSNCHNGISATDKSPTHVTTSAPCETCHNAINTQSYKTFFGAAYKHVDLITACSTCHNGTTAIGKTVKHVVTIAACNVCHTPANTADFTTFVGGVYDHTSSTAVFNAGNRCDSCHNNTTATGKPLYHDVTAGDCHVCHNNFTTFVGGVYDHTSATAAFTAGTKTCASCHDGTTARGVSSAHIPFSGTCNSCHNNASTGVFTTFLGAKFHPANIAGTCSTCHNGTMAAGKNTGHVTTAATCDTCHANAKTSYTNWLGASYIHAIPSGTCSSCHTGSATFGSKAPQGKSALHVPTSAACDTCHANAKSSYTNWLAPTYIHQSPMVDACSTCHRTGGFALAKSAVHVPTSADCGTCHTPATISNYTTFLGATFVHSTPAGACANCHYTNGPALDKSAIHLPTTASCEQCHKNENSGNFTTFMGAVFHTTANSIPGVCSTCHDGTIASGKSTAHVPTNAACSDCHTATNTNSYKTFFGATFVHPTPPGVCVNCHNGTIATGVSATHIPINGAACDTCHNATHNSNGYKTFFGATFVHASPAGVCSTCHNGTTALGKTAKHIVTTAACDVCHTLTNTVNFTTFFGGNYPHPTTGVAGLCSTCHNGTTATGVTPYHVAFTGECDTCHTASNTNGYKTFFGGLYNHPTSGLAACSSCHNGLNARGPSAVHIPTNNVPCDTCHKNATSTPTVNFTSFSVNVVFVHDATPSVCSTCHNGINGIRAKGMSAALPSHVPTSAACDTCHANAKNGYTSWLAATYIHPSPAGTCETCHNGNTVFSTKKPLGKSLTHLPTLATCESCHVPSGYVAWATGARYVHPTPAGVCESCHNGAYLSAFAKTTNHVPTTAACDSCHAGAKSYTPTGWATPPATYIHANPAGTCSTCHNGTSNFGSTSTPKGKTTGIHVETNLACDLCHTKSLADQVWPYPAINFIHNTPPGACRDCHISGPAHTFMSSTHVSTTAACDICHSQANTGNFTSFLGATFVHGSPLAVCSSCHNATGPGKNMSAAHISTPALAECDTCHTPANTNNFKTFLGATYVHTTLETAGKCDTCHKPGGSGLGKSVNHVATTAQCDVCHTPTNTANFTTFLGGLYSHPTTGVSGLCSTCHNGTTAKDKPILHFALQCDSAGCHNETNTNGYKTFLGATFDHAAYAGSGNTLVCETCHAGLNPTARTRSTSHLVTTYACADCHKSYISFLGASYIHEATAGTCTTCHNGTIAKTKSAAHVSTSAACEVCHLNDTSNDFTSFSVSFQYKHAANPGVCSTCHNGVSIYGPSTAPQGKIAAKPVHVSTTAACDTCHANAKTSYTNWMNATYLHATPAGTCSTCHTGTAAYGTNSRPEGKSATHVPTTAACDKCHTKTNTGNYATWFGATFVHITPVGTCSPACHSATTAGNSFSNGALTPSGKMAGSFPHVTTTAQCSTCHTKTNTLNYMTFAGGNIYVHATQPGTCATCHAGGLVYGASTTPMGKSAIHVPTLQKCDLCHTKTATTSYKFWTAVYVHEATPGVCRNCHGGTWTYSGVAPRGITSAPNHFPTTEACDLCHTKTNTSNYTVWTGAIWSHNNPGGICLSCHDGVKAIGTSPGHFQTNGAQCDTCHTQSNTLNYTTFLGAIVDHTTGTPARKDQVCSTCHNGAAAIGKPGWHMLTSEACNVCHTQANTNNFTTFNGAVIDVNHTTILAGDCIRCHNGSGAKGVNNAPGHIPVAGIQCDGCHDKFNGTTVVSFGLRAMNHVLTAATRCDVCHNGNYTTQGPLGALGKVLKHIPTTITGTLDCTTCHRITVSASVATMSWTNQVMNHNNAQGGGVPILCITCHFTGTTYQGSMDKKSHEGASATKDCSSAGCHKPKGSRGVAYSTWD